MHSRNHSRKQETRERVAHPSRMLASASRDRELFLCDASARDSRIRTRLFRRDAKTSTRDACATRKTEPDWTIFHNKFPPTPRVGLVRLTSLRRSQTAATTGRIVQLSFFFLRRSFFALHLL